MHTTVVARSERTEEFQRQRQRLREAVYPPGEGSDEPPLGLTWSKPELSVVVRIQEDGDILGHAGVLTRDGLLDGERVLIGGIGGVQTHPEFRHRGLGRAVMTRAADLLRDEFSVAFSLLVCPDEAREFYRRLGWIDFDGTLWIEQPDGRKEFSGNNVMVLSGRRRAPRSGTIDLLGSPW
jgi:aminoglycoside 2'-N-acetyltransferase I